MASLIRHSNLFALIVSCTIILVSHIRFFIYRFPTEEMGNLISPVWWELCISAVLLLLTSFIVYSIGNEMSVLKGYSTFPIVVFAVMASGIYLPPSCISSSLGALCLALAMSSLLKFIKYGNSLEHVFYWGLCIGISAYLNSSLVVLAIVMIFVTTYTSISLRTCAIAFVGFVIPILSVGYVKWYLGASFIQYLHELIYPILNCLSLPVVTMPFPIGTCIVSTTILLLATLGLWYALGKAPNMLLKERSGLISTIIMAIVVFVGYVFAGMSSNYLPILAVPGSIIITFSLNSMKEKNASRFYWVLVSVTVIHQFFPFA